MMSAYGAAKAGVAQLTQTLAIELAPHGIRVNAVAPAFIDTPASRANVSDERRRLSAETIPLRRIGDPYDIAGPVVWLASPLSAFVTGQTIAVDGGLTTTVLRPPRASAAGERTSTGPADVTVTSAVERRPSTSL
jgi:3-oxoacyl-[acyl-carrier protein] reductase